MTSATLTDFYTYMSRQRQKEEVQDLYIKKYGNIIGEKHSMLTIIGILPNCSRNKGARVDCLCECGGLKETYLAYLRSKNVRSCGCLRPTPKSVYTTRIRRQE